MKFINCVLKSGLTTTSKKTMINRIVLYDTTGECILTPEPIDYILYAKHIPFHERVSYIERNYYSISVFFMKDITTELFYIALWQEDEITPETERLVMPYFEHLFKVWYSGRIDNNVDPLIQLLKNDQQRVEIIFDMFEESIYLPNLNIREIHDLALLCVGLNYKRTFDLLELDTLYSLFYLEEYKRGYKHPEEDILMWTKLGNKYKANSADIIRKSRVFLERIQSMHESM